MNRAKRCDSYKGATYIPKNTRHFRLLSGFSCFAGSSRYTASTCSDLCAEWQQITSRKFEGQSHRWTWKSCQLVVRVVENKREGMLVSPSRLPSFCGQSSWRGTCSRPGACRHHNTVGVSNGHDATLVRLCQAQIQVPLFRTR